MDNRSDNRKIIEEVVNRHPRLSRVAQYLAERHDLDVETVKSKFLDFLESEGFSYHDNVPHNVLCFEYVEADGRFVNRTKFSPANPY